MTFLPTAEEREFQEALRGFLAKEHDLDSVRRLADATTEQRAEVTRSVRDFGVFEWVHEAGARALALTAREAGRALLASPVVEDALWGVLVHRLVPGLPWEVEAACSGAVRVSGIFGELKAGRLIVGLPGVQFLLRVIPEGSVIEVFEVGADAFGAVACLDGSLSLGEVATQLTQPVWRAEGVASEAHFVKALWYLLLSAQVIGAAERCVELFQSHGTARRQFGVPIAGFQAVQQQAAAHFAKLSAASALCSFAEWCAMHDRDQVERVALSSWEYTSRIARPLAESMVQIHGGIGFTWEYDLHLFFRRIIALDSLHRLAPEEEHRIMDATPLW